MPLIMRGLGAAQTFDALLTRAGAKGDLIEKLKGNVAAGTAFKTKNCFRAAIGASGQRKVFSSPTLQGARGKCVRGGGRDGIHEVSGGIVRRGQTASWDFLGVSIPEESIVIGPSMAPALFKATSRFAFSTIGQPG